MFSSNKLLKLKYIHNFFLKFLTKKSQRILWVGASFGPGNTVVKWTVLFYFKWNALKLTGKYGCDAWYLDVPAGNDTEVSVVCHY